MNMLVDTFGRRFPYLRLSITDVCNFRCTYCLPNGYSGPGMKGVLSVHEIRRLVTAFAQLGTRKVRLTGGEPTLRSDLFQILEALSTIETLDTIALTTNGYHLPQHAHKLVAHGVNHLNVSIDSFNAQTFKKITGHDRLAEIMDGLKACQESGLTKIKINAVLMRGLNDHEMHLFDDFVRHNPIDVRFIEVMQTGDNAAFFRRHHQSLEPLMASLQDKGWTMAGRSDTAGPARLFQHPSYAGRLGFIAPYSKGFCDTCNRLRITSRGGLRLCLFADGDHNLRPLLQHDEQLPDLQASITTLLLGKSHAHRLSEANPGATQHLAEIGG